MEDESISVNEPNAKADRALGSLSAQKEAV